MAKIPSSKFPTGKRKIPSSKFPKTKRKIPSRPFGKQTAKIPSRKFATAKKPAPLSHSPGFAGEPHAVKGLGDSSLEPFDVVQEDSEESFSSERFTSQICAGQRLMKDRFLLQLHCLNLFDRFECGIGTANVVEEPSGSLQRSKVNRLTGCWLSSSLADFLSTT